MLSAQAIKEFQQIYRDTFREEISDVEAARRANNMMRLYRAVLLSPRGSMHDVSESYDRPNKHN